MRIGEARAILALAMPAVFEPRNSPFMEKDRAPGAFRIAFHSRLPPHERHEERERHSDPPDRDAVECVPNSRGRAEKNKEAQIPYSVPPEFGSPKASSALSKSISVDLARHRARVHQGQLSEGAAEGALPLYWN